MILFSTPAIKLQYRDLSPALKNAVMAIAFESNINGPDWMVTAIKKDSPSHREGKSIDIAPRLRSASHPIEKGESIRMTDRRLVHAWLIKVFEKHNLKVCLAVENDHFHIDTIHNLGVYRYDNPRREYTSESLLLPGGVLHTQGTFDFQKLVPIWVP